MTFHQTCQRYLPASPPDSLRQEEPEWVWICVATDVLLPLFLPASHTNIHSYIDTSPPPHLVFDRSFYQQFIFHYLRHQSLGLVLKFSRHSSRQIEVALFTQGDTVWDGQRARGGFLIKIAIEKALLRRNFPFLFRQFLIRSWLGVVWLRFLFLLTIFVEL